MITIGPLLKQHVNRQREGLSEDRITFEVASSTDFPSKDDGYDLVVFVDSLHDMGDPGGAASHVLNTLKPDGTLLIVEPFANDKVEDNLNPLGRIFYAGSIQFVYASLAHNGTALEPKQVSLVYLNW